MKDDSFVIVKKNRTKALKAIQVQVPEGTEVEGWLASPPFPLSLSGWIEEDKTLCTSDTHKWLQATFAQELLLKFKYKV